MSDAGPPPKLPPGVARARLPFDMPAAKAGGKGAAVWFYLALALVLAGLALYMALVNHMALMSPYVIAPTIGAAWFGLRVFMLIAPKG